jgi:hypothetical protein
VSQDARGSVLIGTTTGGSFSLNGWATFLPAAAPDLRAVLNLDGEPYACQAVSSPGEPVSSAGTMARPGTTGRSSGSAYRPEPVTRRCRWS